MEWFSGVQNVGQVLWGCLKNSSGYVCPGVIYSILFTVKVYKSDRYYEMNNKKHFTSKFSFYSQNLTIVYNTIKESYNI